MGTIWNILAAAHADVVLSGHNHDYERFDPLGASPPVPDKFQDRPRPRRDPRVRRRHRGAQPLRLRPPAPRRRGRPELDHLRRPRADAAPDELRLALRSGRGRRVHRRRLGVLPLSDMRALVATVLAGLVAATAAQAARTEEAGSGIYAVGVADRKLVRLVEDPTGEGAPIAPSWAGDAGSIVFARLPCDGCASEIRRVPVPVRGESDGLGVVIGTASHPPSPPREGSSSSGSTAGCTWSPCAAGRSAGCSRPGRDAPAVDQPNVSRDGRRVVFVRHDIHGRGWIETVRMDGSGRRRLTRSGGYANPAWSPDGRRLAFARQDATGRWGICVTKADGSGLRVIRHFAASDSYPTWSPDGTRLAFVRELRFGHALYVVNVDGSGLRRLTPSSVDAIEPTWSPRGDRLAFAVIGVD